MRKSQDRFGVLARVLAMGVVAPGFTGLPRPSSMRARLVIASSRNPARYKRKYAWLEALNTTQMLSGHAIAPWFNNSTALLTETTVLESNKRAQPATLFAKARSSWASALLNIRRVWSALQACD